MGDKSPKDRAKKNKQHDKHVAEINRSKLEKTAKRAENEVAPNKDQQRKAG